MAATTTSTRRPRGAPRPVVRRAAVAATAGLLLATAGCGIRSTDVPVDAGPAPTVVSCEAPKAADTVALYLVCESRVEPVRRKMPQGGQEPDQDLDALATMLLKQLQSEPPREEQAAGFSSSVAGSLRVAPRAPSDPERVIRLSQHPEELPAVTLAQIVCTFAAVRQLNTDGGVLLGGPADDRRAASQPYNCASSLRHLPKAEHTISRP